MLKKQSESLVCDFENIDDLFRAAEEIRRSDEAPQSSLFELDKAYRLILSRSSESLCGILSEFCKVRNCSRMLTDFTNEHWNLLASDNAVEKLLDS